jgi:hypothetical protein
MIAKHIQKMPIVLVESTPMKKYKTVPNVVTEDLGKIFEKAICLLYETPYDGNYKYALSEAEVIKERLGKLKEVFPGEIKHIAKNGSKYDFVRSDGVYLSAKTTKRDGKVCPQEIGQPSKKRFCHHFKLGDLTTEQIKSYIMENVCCMLDEYIAHTFECPMIYYNQSKNELLFVKLKEKMNWTNITFSHVIKNKAWNESTTIKIDNVSIGEFQIHNHRDGIKFRWSFKNMLTLFKDHFEITVL